MKHQQRSATAALVVLIVLQAIMLFSLYAGVPPHPPAKTPLFGIAPFVGAAIAVAAAALVLGPRAGLAGRGASLLAAVLALVSFGPQKYLDPQIALVWPAVLCGQVAVAIVAIAAFRPAAAD